LIGDKKKIMTKIKVDVRTSINIEK